MAVDVKGELVDELPTNGNGHSSPRPDSRFSSGQAWEGFRKNWIWQSGVTYSPNPLVGDDDSNPGVSGVYVNDSYYSASTVGAYAHYIDHFNGRVVFDSPIPTGSKVQAEFSYKWVNVVYANS